MAAKEPKTPDELLKLINSSTKDTPKDTGDGTVYDPEIKVQLEPPRSVADVNGFQTPIARDVFMNTGNREAAQRAEDLIYLFGNEELHVFDRRPKGHSKDAPGQTGLYDQIKLAASCQGQQDEAFWLRQHLWYLLEADKADLTGCDPESYPRTQTDDQPGSPENAHIASYLGPSALGRIRMVARDKGIRNAHALQVIVKNYLQSLRTL